MGREITFYSPLTTRGSPPKDSLDRVPRTCLPSPPPLLSGMRRGRSEPCSHPSRRGGGNAYKNRTWELEKGLSFSCASRGSWRRRWVWVGRALADSWSLEKGRTVPLPFSEAAVAAVKHTPRH